MGETPFRLAYRTDVIIPVEVGSDSYCNEVFNMENNELGLKANVNFLQEEREASPKKPQIPASGHSILSFGYHEEVISDM